MAKFLGDWFVLAILTAIIWGTVPFFEKRGATALPPAEAVFVRCFAASLGMLVSWAIKPSMLSSLQKIGWEPILWMMGGGLIGSVLGQFTNLAALRTGEISRISPVTASWPIITFAIGLLAFGEKFSWIKLAGLVLVVGGVVLMRLEFGHVGD